MKKYLYLTIINLVVLVTADAQIVPLKNHSLEGVGPRKNRSGIPPEWLVESGNPETWLGDSTSLIWASDGIYFSYLRGFYLRRDARKFHPTAIGQELSTTLTAGRTYTLSFDMAYCSLYTDTLLYHYAVDFANLKITGSGDGYTDVFYKSPRIKSHYWVRDTIVFTPTRNTSYMTFSTYDDGDSSTVGTILDNFSEIRETIKLELTSNNTCIGKKIGSVSVTIPGGDDTYTYLWEPGGYTTSTVSDLPSNFYSVTVKSGRGLTAYGRIAVSTSDISLRKKVTPISCYGETDAIIEIIPDAGQAPYKFTLNDTGFNNTGIFKDLPPGAYHFKVEDKQQCKADEEIIVDIFEPPLFQLKNMRTKGVICSSAKDGQIILTATGGTLPYTYSIPGLVSQPDSVLRQLDEGKYHYVVTDSHHCMDEGYADISKDWRECGVFVPNAFSPNRDGLNDEFRVKLLDDVSEYRLSIYSGWGAPVFESSNPEGGWDGTRRGEMLPTGTYIWSLVYTNSKKQPMKQTGTVTLVR